jgi:homoserine O-acetyltransferase
MRFLALAASLIFSLNAYAQPAAYPAPVERDFIASDFVFANGERMAEVKIHYRTVGRPLKDADGVVRNGVLILHGTGGTGAGFLGQNYGGRLFGKGQPLDAEKYFIILPDNVGHGQSSKPSDGLRVKFPKYRYTDMVKLQYELVTKGLGLTSLRLVMGTSMGAMHAWNWGYMYPGFAAGLVPLASNPVEIGGLNRVWRKLLIDAIEQDHTWMNGDYQEQPRGLANAIGFLMIATSAPLQWQKQFPTIAAADRYVADQIAARSKNTDANDMLYYFHAIEDYNPAPHLSKITAPLLAINSADDFVNPPELPMMRELIAQVKRGRFVLLPITDETRGHGTHSLPAIWGPELARFLAEIESAAAPGAPPAQEFGAGAYRPGPDITLPRVVREVKPAYTRAALQAQIQGSVWLECVIMPDGTVGDVRVTTSLDRVLGLDQEAINAARQWRFTPGTRLGKPVPVIVTMSLSFTVKK